MLKRLKLKFVIINMTIVTIMLSLVFGLLIHFTEEDLEQNSLNMMHSVVRGNMMMPGRPDVPPSEIRLPFFIIRSDNEKNTVFGGDFFDLSDEALIEELLETSALSSEPVGVIEEYKLRYMRINAPDFQQIIFSDISSEISTMKNLRHTCMLIGTASFLAFLAISIILANWAIKPVEKSWQQQKQFVADASHELKTPLTVIISNAELLQSSDFDEFSKQGFSQNILTMAGQMRCLVENLLDLARVDSGSSKISRETLDFSSVVLESSLGFEALFFEKSLDFHYDIEEKLSVFGSKDYLKRVVDVLLDNAQKYSHSASPVQLSLKKSADYALLKVSNQGNPLSQEDLKNIFKRFWRQDQARSRNGSFGLGLSIAESIVLDHKGKIWAESNDGKNIFYVQLPLK